jgi:hypothetical protein
MFAVSLILVYSVHSVLVYSVHSVYKQSGGASVSQILCQCRAPHMPQPMPCDVLLQTHA